MTGPEHYQQAERHTREAAETFNAEPEFSAWLQQQAQVHATLALAAATATNDAQHGLPVTDWNAWQDVAGVNDAWKKS